MNASEKEFLAFDIASFIAHPVFYGKSQNYGTGTSWTIQNTQHKHKSCFGSGHKEYKTINPLHGAARFLCVYGGLVDLLTHLW